MRVFGVPGWDFAFVVAVGEFYVFGGVGLVGERVDAFWPGNLRCWFLAGSDGLFVVDVVVGVDRGVPGWDLVGLGGHWDF